MKAHPCAHCGAPLRKPPTHQNVRSVVYDGRYGGAPVYADMREPTIEAFCDDVVCLSCGEHNWPDLGQIDPPSGEVTGMRRAAAEREGKA